MIKKIKYIFIFSIIFIFLFSLIKPKTFAWGIDAGSIKVNYIDEDGNDLYIVESDNGKLNYNFVFGQTGKEYNVISPAYDGYKPDYEVITGNFNGDIETTVTYYRIKKCTLTINCLDENNNIIQTLNYEYDKDYEYDIDLDIIDGMEPEISKAQGVLDKDTTIDVKYSYRERIVIIHYYDVNFRRLLFDEYIIFKGNGYLKIFPPLMFGYYHFTPFTIYVDKDMEIFVSYQIVSCVNHYVYYYI